MRETLGAADRWPRRRKVSSATAPVGDPGSSFVTTPHPTWWRYRGVMDRLWSFCVIHGLDAVIVLLAAAAAAGTVVRAASEGPDGFRLAVEASAVVLMILTLLLRRRAPLLAPASTWLVSAALSFADGSLIVDQAPISIAGMVAAVLLGNLRRVGQARVGSVVVVTCAAAVTYNDPAHTVGDLVFVPALFTLGWLVGFTLQERAVQMEVAGQRADRAEREREGATRVAVAEERARIARELHDVVAHAVSVMVLQVGAVRHRMSADDAEDREALRNVEHAGRTALTEMRQLLHAMRRDEDETGRAPQPGMGSLTRLLDDVRTAGLDVRLQVHGEPVHLSPGLDLSAYRILQEGLTNALRHAHARYAEVHVHYRQDELELEVRDDGRGPCGPVDPEQPHGHGLIGVRERVKIYGGDLTVGARAAGGFSLRARLPLGESVHE